ncbi:hypothetical protein ABFS82_14G246800 [Erythranthe guttata]|uniref:dof zinc finger protein DOF2.1 n=1 Tax=Erythranthe guttata TaxID=4155 RepID=UPI00064DF5E3|nr:PREDICTED: dof zinc finger protein DOF2.1 [Erythranthe guttata]|eukprot:XP_012838649.1 PREDICTED: dof zinc finger protein DOF2.1 [Erythranthe guttata]
MAMDSSFSQEMGSQTLESMVVIGTKGNQEKKATNIRAGDQLPQNCPRCDSTNTKFCYYNNYSLSQPRYFCKSCRRYWTKGGTLRNVPVGGGCRKNKRSSSSSSSSKRSSISQDEKIPSSPNPNCFNIPTLCNYDSGNPNMPLGGGGGNVLENPRGFHNLYYGIGDSGINLGMGISGGGGGIFHEMGFDQEFGGGAITTSTAKQEISGGGGGGESGGRGLWGFPWLQSGNVNAGGDGNYYMGDLDSDRGGSWNGIASSNWHGLLNSPLM